MRGRCRNATNTYARPSESFPYPPESSTTAIIGGARLASVANHRQTASFKAASVQTYAHFSISTALAPVTNQTTVGDTGLHSCHVKLATRRLTSPHLWTGPKPITRELRDEGDWCFGVGWSRRTCEGEVKRAANRGRSAKASPKVFLGACWRTEGFVACASTRGAPRTRM